MRRSIPISNGVRTVAGDYVENQLAERMDRAELIGDIVTHWHKYGERPEDRRLRRQRRALAFTCATNSCESGVRAEHIDGSTPKAERDATLARLASGEIELVTNCMVLTEGWDMPDVGCCILARPTKKMGLYRQMIGRVLRPAEGKPDAIVLDHSGAVFRHGFVEDRVEWTLDPDRRAASPTHQQRGPNGGSRLLECTQCGAVARRRRAVLRIVDSCRSGRRAASRFCRRRTRPGRRATAGRKPISPIRRCARAGTACWPTSPTSAATSRAGSRTSTKKNSAPGRRGARGRNLSRRPPKCAVWVRSRLIAFAKEVGMKKKTNAEHDQRAICAAHDRDAAVAGVARAEPDGPTHS